jgi:hypothetical protein
MNLPLAFEPNLGQTSARADFLLHGSRFSLFLSAQGFRIQLPQVSDRPVSDVEMTLVGASPFAKPEGLGHLPGLSNYFVGNDPEEWRTRIPHYGRVQYGEV